MKRTHYLTKSVQKGNKLEISLPELAEGQIVEVILILPENQEEPINNVNVCSTESSHINYNIMKLSVADRRKILAEQAEAMKDHYDKDKSWQEWINLDLDEFYEY